VTYFDAGVFGEPHTPRAPLSPPPASWAGSNEQFRSMMNTVQLQIANLTNLVANMTNGTPHRAESERSAIWAPLPPALSQRSRR
jgi:hypothetical protein